MGTVRQTITLTEQQDAWVKAQINRGNYANFSALIRDLIHREQKRSAERDVLQQALIEGENSGKPQPLDFDAFTRRKLAQHR